MKNKPELWISENWQKKSQPNAKLHFIEEFSVFSDCYLGGQICNEKCPYHFLNNTCQEYSPILLPRYTLRIKTYHTNDVEDKLGNFDIDIDDSTKLTVPSKITGSDKLEDFYIDLDDSTKLTVLLSLCLGIRLKIGCKTRITRSDPLGQPQYENTQKNLLPLKLINNRYILPGLINSNKIKMRECSGVFLNSDKLNRENMIKLLKSANLYCQAIWIAEHEPNLAWVLFVSAIENAAKYYWENRNIDKISTLKDNCPEIFSLLKSERENKKSKSKNPKLTITEKFIAFIIHFFPEEPPSRPSEIGRIIWEKKQFYHYLDKIYDYRSRTLHNGYQFPTEMLRPPEIDPCTINSTEKLLMEKPYSYTYTGGQSLATEEKPMNLHTFEYVVRKALIKWWNELLTI